MHTSFLILKAPRTSIWHRDHQVLVNRAGLPVALPTWTSNNSRRRSKVSSFSFNFANLLLVVASDQKKKKKIKSSHKFENCRVSKKWTQRKLGENNVYRIGQGNRRVDEHWGIYEKWILYFPNLLELLFQHSLHLWFPQLSPSIYIYIITNQYNQTLGARILRLSEFSWTSFLLSSCRDLNPNWTLVRIPRNFSKTWL